MPDLVEEYDPAVIEEVEDIVFPRFCVHCEHLEHTFEDEPCKSCVKFKIRLGSYTPLEEK